MRVPFNDLSRAACGDEAEAISDVIRRGWFLLGEETDAFEREFAAYLGVAHVVAVGSGTAALGLALAGVGATQHDVVVTAANAGGYCATAARREGLDIRYADVDPRDLLISADTVEAALTEETAIVVVTHLYGQMAPVEEIREVCRPRGIAVLEDCAQSAGARVVAGYAGTFGDAAAFSFYPTKNLGAFGDAGAVATNRPEVAERVRRLRQYGWSSKYHVDLPGGRNSRMDEIQAAVLRVRLGALEEGNTRRRAITARYADALDGTSIRVLQRQSCDFVAHLAVLVTPDRAAIQAGLRTRGIESAVHYPVPDHLQKGLREPIASLPITERVADRVLSVPCFPELRAAELDAVCAALAELAGDLA